MIYIIVSTLHLNYTMPHEVDTIIIIFIFFTKVKNEAQRGKVTCCRSRNQGVIEPGLELWLQLEVWFQSQLS